MNARKMHAAEVATDAALVRRLLAAQFPQWAELPITPVESAGTDNAIYRLGDDMSVRLPRIYWATGQVEKERRWLPALAPLLPLAIPVPLAKGAPGEGYPWEWGVYQWLRGENPSVVDRGDLRQVAVDLAAFITALQCVDPAGGPLAAEEHLRGMPLAVRDASTREAIASARAFVDADAATAAWETARQAPEWDRAPVWFHGDLLPGNLLLENGMLRAVIDFSGLGVGDPACDLMSAWGLFTGESREAFRSAVAPDDATWARARGHALSQALMFIPYYRKTNPLGVKRAQRAVDEILAEHARDS